MKKMIYTNPEIEIVLVASEDICALSGYEQGGTSSIDWSDMWTGEDKTFGMN